MLTKWKSADYYAALALRNCLLQQTAGKPSLQKAPLEEQHDFHLIIKQENKVIGTLLLHPVQNGIVQIKQVAVDPNCQGSGFGKQLIAYAERMSITLGFSLIFLTGRQQAWHFYEKLAYIAVSNAYTEKQIILKVYKKRIYPTKELKTNG